MMNVQRLSVSFSKNQFLAFKPKEGTLVTLLISNHFDTTMTRISVLQRRLISNEVLYANGLGWCVPFDRTKEVHKYVGQGRERYLN